MTDAAVGALPASPFKGLMPFEDSERDALLFFGRERECEVVSANLMASRLTVLYGESGVGKTSLLAAGVLYDLRGIARRNLAERGHPEFVVLMFSSWSEDPIAGLLEVAREALSASFGPAAVPDTSGAASLADTLQSWTEDLGCDLLLILDQAEEYFLYHEGEEGPGTFAEELPELVTRGGLRVSVLLSIREDALAKLDRFKARIPNLFGNYLRLDHLDREAARAAIVGPIDQFNRLAGGADPVEAEPELVEAVLNETAAGRVELGQAGRGVVRDSEVPTRIEAPYLQLVLERLWDAEIHAGSRTLRLATLRRLGGAAEIVRSHLERALEELSPGQKDIAASLFNYLVTPSGTKIAHAAGDLAEYASVAADELAPVLTTLVRERILRPAATRDGARARDGSPVEIFHDVLSNAVLAWRSRHEAERTLDLQRWDAERRHRRTLLLAGGAMLALAIVSAVAVFALVQRSEARDQAREARAQRAEARVSARTARARELAARAVSQLPTDPNRGLALAAQAARLEETDEIENVLRSALLASHLRAILPAGSPVTNAAFSPDGQRILTASRDGKARIYDVRANQLTTVLDHRAPLRTASFGAGGRLVVTAGSDGTARVWEAASGKPVHALHHSGALQDAEFSRDGRWLVTASADHTARVWATSDGSSVSVLRHERPVRAASFNPDARLVVTVSDDSRARVFDARTGRLLFAVDQGGRVTSARFSPTGSLLVTAGLNRVARVWSPATGRLVHELAGHEGPVLAAVPGPRGKLLVTTSTDGSARVWYLPRGQLRTILIGHTNYVTSGSFDPAGFSLVTTSTDRTARVWKPGTGNVRVILAGHTDSVTSASFSPDGRAVVTASEDGTARLWDPEVQPELSVIARLPGPVASSAFSPNGRLILIGDREGVGIVAQGVRGAPIRLPEVKRAVDAAFSRDGTLVAAASGKKATIWRMPSRNRVRVLSYERPVVALAFSPDGREIATAGADGVARLSRLDGSLVRAFRGHRGPLTRVAFSPDGRRLVTASDDRTARIWNRATGAVEHVLVGHRGTVTSAAFSPDGLRLVTASSDHDARTWDVRSGKLLRVLRGHFAVVSDASFSPDGRWIVTAGPITAGLWHAEQGRLLLYLRGPQARITRASFDGAGRRVLVSSVDRTVRTYRCEICGALKELVELAEARLERTRVSR